MSPNEVTEALIKSAPHAAFSRIAVLGYTLQHEQFSQELVALIVSVFLADQRVANAEFANDERHAYCQNVNVEEGHQRRGLATAMYLLAELVLEKQLSNYWNGHPWQSVAAKAMWANPDRAFGHMS